jgi:hypothetical protein
MDVNVWMLDYSGVSAGPVKCYLAAVFNLPSVGKCTALFVRKIMELSEVKEHKDIMHVIGFSLGGQLAGHVAEHLKPVKLPRITGLLAVFTLRMLIVKSTVIGNVSKLGF